jgi:hypothetical protein
MTRTTTIGLRLGALLIVAGFWAAPLRAQETCEALVARAFNEFDTARRIELLVSAVNPTTCPPRGSWTVGVQLLAQTLIEDGKDSLAAVWLRWAVRVAPDMQPDTVQFLPRVVAAFRSARAFVSNTRAPMDSAAATTWVWPMQAAGSSQGVLQVASASAPLRVEVARIGPVGVGGRISLAAGSYGITASSPGLDTLRVTREVLPGVTTALDFHLRTAPPVQVANALPAVVAPRKKGIPTWVKLGAAAGVAWAIAWNAYIKSH